MHYRILELNSHQEAAELKEQLKLNYIPCTIGQYTQNSKTGETEKNNYFLSFPNENLNDYNKIIKDQNPTKLLRIEEVKKERKSNFIKYLLIPYSILISLLCIKYYYSSNLGNSEKNFKYEWSTDNRTLEVVNKNTKKISALYHDHNYDNNWERAIEFSNGRRTSEAFDSNENGVLEKFMFYNTQGQVVRIETDWNQDGLIDTMNIILENEEKLILVDKNKNGTFEILNPKKSSR